MDQTLDLELEAWTKLNDRWIGKVSMKYLTPKATKLLGGLRVKDFIVCSYIISHKLLFTKIPLISITETENKLDLF